MIDILAMAFSAVALAGVLGCYWFLTHSVTRRLDALHGDLNSRLTQLLDLTRSASFAEGIEANRVSIEQRNHPIPLHPNPPVYRDPPPGRGQR